MTGFARDAGVFAGCPDLSLIVVTEDAGGLPGIGDRPGPDHGESPWPIVTVLAEGLGNDRAADKQKDAETGQENQRGPNQMHPVSKNATHRHPLRVN